MTASVSGLRRLILGTLLAAFPGPVAPRWAIDLVAGGLAGHVLFGTNVADPAQLAALCGTLRAARPDVLIAIDEEGGDVTRLGHRTGSPYPGNGALGVIDDPALTRAIYRAIGADLSAVGIDLDLAPSVDVNTTSDNPVIGTRSFGADPALVARHAAAAVAGLQDAGVAACVKHFPGHGGTTVDSHLALPTVDVPLDRLRERDIAPFAAALPANAVMTAHIRVPSLTGSAPATFSPAAFDALRTDLGYQGVVITDALEMLGAARYAGGVGPGAVLALLAGADLLCIGAAVTSDLVEDVVAHVTRAIDDGTLPIERLHRARARTQTLTAWIADARHADPPAAGATVVAGIARAPGPVDAAGPAAREAAADGPADLEHSSDPMTRSGAPDGERGQWWPAASVALGVAAARRAIRVEGGWPDLTGALVVQLESTRTIAEGRTPWGILPFLDASRLNRRVVARDASADDLLAAADGCPIVVVGRNLHRLPGAAPLLASLTERARVVVVEMGTPSAWRPEGSAAFITTYGASRASGQAVYERLFEADER